MMMDEQQQQDATVDMAEEMDVGELIADTGALNGEQIMGISKANIKASVGWTTSEALVDDPLDEAPFYYYVKMISPPGSDLEDHWVLLLPSYNIMLDTFGRSPDDLFADFDQETPESLYGFRSVCHKVQNDYSLVCAYYCLLFARMMNDDPESAIENFNGLFVNIPSGVDRRNIATSLKNDALCKELFNDEFKIPHRRIYNAVNEFLDS